MKRHQEEERQRRLADLDAELTILEQVLQAQHQLDAGQIQAVEQQLAYAVRQRRAISTHNSRDDLLLDRSYRAQGLEHAGMLFSDQVP